MTIFIDGVEYKRWRSKLWFIPVQHNPGNQKSRKVNVRKPQRPDPGVGGRRGKH